MKIIFKEFLSEKGRIGRAQYAIFGGISLFLYLLTLSIDYFFLGTIAESLGESPKFGDSGILTLILGFLLFWPAVVLGIKRLQDMDKSGWFLFVFLIPIVGFFLSVVLLLYPGTNGPNKYGDKAKGWIII